jgi:antitoxin HigA-1
MRKQAPVHPGEILLNDFLEPLEITQYRLARDIKIDPRRISLIVQGVRAITADTALRLARYFGNSPQFWLGLQLDYDLDCEQDHCCPTNFHEKHNLV